MLNDFSSQTEIVIKNLIENGYTKEQALDLWYNSKTYYEIVRQKLYYISAMRVLWELKLELENDVRWFNEPFDM